MTEFLLGLIILLLLGVIAFLAALWKRRGGRPEVEGELRSQVAVREAELAGLRKDLAAAESASTEAKTRLESEQKNLAEQRRRLGEDQAQLKEAFKALSADALKDSRTQFLSQADEKLRPIQGLLKDYEQKLDAIEKARNTAYGGLEQHLKSLASAHDVLQKEAHQLSTALRSPTVRGRWGEMTLRRVVEVAGMSPHCDFQEQVSTATEDGTQRPDMIIHLPGRRTIVVDSKVPLAAYMDAAEAKDEAARQTALARHAADVRKHVQALSRKAYWDQFKDAPDFVVLFLPGESFFSAALEQDRTLLEDAMRSRTFLATPTTLMALLGVVAHGWHEQNVAENAEKIGAAGRELFERVSKFVEHFSRVGDGLNRAAKAYNDARGSYQLRVVPAAGRLAEQAALGEKELPDLPPVDGPSRAIAPPEAPDALPPPAAPANG